MSPYVSDLLPKGTPMGAPIPWTSQPQRAMYIIESSKVCSWQAACVCKFGETSPWNATKRAELSPKQTFSNSGSIMKKQLVTALGFGLALALSTASWAQAAGAGGTAGGSSAGGSVGGVTGGSTAPAANSPSSAPSPNPSSPNTVPQSNEAPVSPGTSPGIGRR